MDFSAGGDAEDPGFAGSSPAKMLEGRPMNDGNGQNRRAWSWWYLLFLVQFVAVLWPPFYNKLDPTWIGMPFFYWYQLLWVLVGAVFTAIVYFATEA
jgi:hypothetical protein